MIARAKEKYRFGDFELPMGKKAMYRGKVVIHRPWRLPKGGWAAPMIYGLFLRSELSRVCWKLRAKFWSMPFSPTTRSM